MTYNQFDVVVVPFPFTDTSATKRRPALVMSDEVIFNTPLGQSVMAMITTATHSPWALDVRISDLRSGGLTTTSVVRMKLFTLNHALVLKRIGTLSQKDREAVQKTIKQLFRSN